MEEQNDDIQEKQNFLVKEIIQQNYSPEKFSDYMANLKEDGTDLNNWTLEELQQVVISFKNKENLEGSKCEENIEKEVENIRNSFILSKLEKDNILNNNNINLNNSSSNIFDINEDDIKFTNVENIMSDLNKEEDNIKKNNVWSEIGDFEIIDPSEIVDTSSEKLVCIKQEENSLSKYNDLTVNIEW